MNKKLASSAAVVALGAAALVPTALPAYAQEDIPTTITVEHNGATIETEAVDAAGINLNPGRWVCRIAPVFCP